MGWLRRKGDAALLQETLQGPETMGLDMVISACGLVFLKLRLCDGHLLHGRRVDALACALDALATWVITAAFDALLIAAIATAHVASVAMTMKSETTWNKPA